MTQPKLEDLLLDITISAIVQNANGENNLSNMLFEIDAAVKSRRSVDCVQFEEAWKDVLEDSKQPFLFINFKMSPEVCAAAFEAGEEVNELTWNLVLPFVNGVDADERPESGLDWLEQAELYIANDHPEDFDFLFELIQMDEQELENESD